MKFLGGAKTLDSFLKAYRANETKGFLPTNGMKVQTSLTVRNLLQMKLFSAN